jgi:hypothetical protein
MFAYDGHYDSTSSILVLVGPARVHRQPRLRPGLGDLGVHLGDLPEPDPRPRPEPRLADALGVRGGHLLAAFPPIVGALGGGVAFSIFAVFMVGQLLWVLKVMPETKGVPLEEMERKLGLVHDPRRRRPLAAGAGHEDPRPG